MATTIQLQVQKATDGTVVFQEVKDESDFLAERRISGLYLKNHFLKEIGFSKDNPRLTMTISVSK